MSILDDLFDIRAELQKAEKTRDKAELKCVKLGAKQHDLIMECDIEDVLYRKDGKTYFFSGYDFTEVKE